MEIIMEIDEKEIKGASAVVENEINQWFEDYYGINLNVISNDSRKKLLTKIFEIVLTKYD